MSENGNLEFKTVSKSTEVHIEKMKSAQERN